MHYQVLQWVEHSLSCWDYSPKESLSILEFGSLDINGSVRSILQPISSQYIGVDLQDGPGVDVVASATTFASASMFHIVICCEVFEHTPEWREIIANAYRHMESGGIFIATMAGEGRRPHSAIDELPIREWEYYANVGAWELKRALSIFSQSVIDYSGSDLRCYAIK